MAATANLKSAKKFTFKSGHHSLSPAAKTKAMKSSKAFAGTYESLMGGAKKSPYMGKIDEKDVRMAQVVAANEQLKTRVSQLSKALETSLRQRHATSAMLIEQSKELEASKSNRELPVPDRAKTELKQHEEKPVKPEETSPDNLGTFERVQGRNSGKMFADTSITKISNFSKGGAQSVAPVND